MCWGSGGRRSARDEPRRRGRPLQTFLSVSGPLQGSLQARRERESSSYRGVREEVSSPVFFPDAADAPQQQAAFVEEDFG